MRIYFYWLSILLRFSISGTGTHLSLKIFFHLHIIIPVTTRVWGSSMGMGSGSDRSKSNAEGSHWEGVRGVAESLAYYLRSALLMNVSGHVVDDEPENVVSDEPALAVRLQHEALREGLRGIVVRFELSEDVAH